MENPMSKNAVMRAIVEADVEYEKAQEARECGPSLVQRIFQKLNDKGFLRTDPTDGLCDKCKDQLFTIVMTMCPECKSEKTCTVLKRCALCAIDSNKCALCDKIIAFKKDAKKTS